MSDFNQQLDYLNKMISDFNQQLDYLNKMIIDIIHNMQTGHDSRGKIESLFSHISDFRQYYETTALVSREVEELDRQISANKLEIESVRNRLTSELKEYRATLSTVFDDKTTEALMNRYRRQGVFGLKTGKLRLEIANKLSSPEFKEILDRIEQTSSIETDRLQQLSAMDSKKGGLLNTSRCAKVNIAFLDKFRLFCNEVIDNFRETVIFTNENTRLYQVRVQSQDNLYTQKESWSDTEQMYPVTRANLVHPVMAVAVQTDQVYSRVDEHEPVFDDILDVFDEDEEYYYGIYHGVSVFTPKNNCTKIDNPERCLLRYFVMTNRFANKLLLNNFSRSRDQESSKKCALFLFEHTGCVVLDPVSYTVYHGHYSDDVPSIVPECCSSRNPYSRAHELRANLLSLSVECEQADLDFSYGYYARDNSFQRLLWDHFIRLLRSEHREVNKKVLLQNMKCLFAKSDARQIQLYRHVDDALSEQLRYGFHYTQNTEKLIDIFIPEIQFLLLIRNLFALKKRNPTFRIPESYLSRWELYISVNNLGKDATPEDYLLYLCRDVLSNLISHDQYQQLLTQSSEMSVALLEMLSYDGSFYNTMRLIITQIHRIVSKIMNHHKKDGGRLKSKKNRVQIKKSRNQTKKLRN